MRKIFFVIFLFFVGVPLSSGKELSWGTGNLIKISYKFLTDIGSNGDYVLVIVPYLKLPNGTLTNVPYLKVKGDLYRYSNEIFCGEFFPIFSPEVGYGYYALVNRNFILSADKLVLVIGPGNGMVKDNVQDMGTFLDSTYKITFYGFTVSNGVSWKDAEILETGGTFYPWDFHEDTLKKVNAVVEGIASDEANFDRIVEIVKHRLGKLTSQEEDLFNVLEFYKKQKVDIVSKHALLSVIGELEIEKLYKEGIFDYFDVEKMWLWGKSFVQLLNSCGKLADWDSSFFMARKDAIIGKDPADNLVNAMAVVQSCAAENYYKSVTQEGGYYLNALTYFFTPVAEMTGFNIDKWRDDLLTYSGSSTVPASYLFTYWFSTINYFMQEVERGQSVWIGLVTQYIEVAENWVFSILGGNMYARLSNDFNIWKSAVMADDYPLARDTREDLMGILNQVISNYGG